MAGGCACGNWNCRRFADETGLAISVCHFPPGTSKWNKVEHRLFSFISSNWRGEPLRDYETVVKLIAKTTTAKGLTVTCRLDRRKYSDGPQSHQGGDEAGQSAPGSVSWRMELRHQTSSTSPDKDLISLFIYGA